MIVDPLNDGGGTKYVLAESGVDNEVGINSVQHDFHLAFNAENRSNAGSYFQVQLIEPNGLSLFSRIAYIASQLSIANHIHALYILELKLIGWSDDDDPKPTEIHTQEWLTKCYGIQHSFADNTSQYTMTMIETKEGVYDRVDFNFPVETSVEASNLGEFATKLQTEINKAAKVRADLDPSSILPTLFKFSVPTAWKDWQFSTVINDADGSGRQVSITGSGSLKFVFPAGTAITNMLAEASYATEQFRKIPTTVGKFAGKSIVVDAKELANIINWISFDVNVKFVKFDSLANRYQRELTFNMIPYATTQAIIDKNSHKELIDSKDLQKKRLAQALTLGLLKKRFDYYLTGQNTEVLDLSIQFNNAYYVLQPLHSGITQDPASTLTESGGPGDNILENLAQQVSTLTQNIQDLRLKIPDSADQAINLGNQIRTLVSNKTALETRVNSINDLAQGNSSNLNGVGPRDSASGEPKYITQQDVIGLGLDPTSHVTFNNYSLNSNGPENSGSNQASQFQARLGALKLNLNGSGDMLSINISVRGDPYWLAKAGTFDNGGPLFFLNVNFPSYSADGDYTATTSEDLNLAGLYNVIKVTSQYQNGQFIMTLHANRNLPTNSGLIYEQLALGQITDSQAANQVEALDLRQISLASIASDASGPR